MKILKAITVFMKKLITKIISVFKTGVSKPKITITTASRLPGDITAETVQNTVAGYAKTRSELMIQEYKNRLKRSEKIGKPSIREKYVIMNGKCFLGYVTSKQKLFGILNYDFSMNHKRHVSFDTKEETYKFMADEYRTCFNKMWNIESMFKQPINGYNQDQGMKLIHHYMKQLNNSKIGTILVCDINGCNGDFDGDTLSTYNVH